MLFVMYRIGRQVFKGTKGVAKIGGLLEKERHPHIVHAYTAAAVVVYTAHIIVSLSHGWETEGCVTAMATMIELVAHLCGG